MATCYRHAGRETGVSCSNCERPICTDCMTPTPVGMRCPECSRQKTQVRTIQSVRSTGFEVTRVLIAINVVIWLAELATGGGNGGGRGVVFEYGALFAPNLLAENGDIVKGVADGGVWRLVTAGFLHSPDMPFGLLHIGFNMYLLWMLGQMLEPAYGRVRFLAVYFAALLAGSFGAVLITPDAPTVGASGAVFGLMAAAFVETRARGVDPWQSGIGGLIVINLVFTFALSGISIGGHLGGLAGGALAALALQYGDRYGKRVVGLLGVGAIAVASVAAGIAAAQQGV